MKKTFRLLKSERKRMEDWRKFMKVLKYFKPHPVPMKVMNKIMGCHDD